MTETPAQQKAIAARGNVLVVAGAGTGKTRTLVQRCLACLLDADNPASLDEILMVTFTEAAAAEMRRRLREELEAHLARSGDPRIAEQLALLDTARIGTLHSFCFQLAREHFHELQLDPALSVLPDEQAQLLARETLDVILERNYRGETPIAAAVQELIQKEGRGWDLPVRHLVSRVHAYAQTLTNPQEWFDRQFQYLEDPTANSWLKWLMQALAEWRNSWLPILENLPLQNRNGRQCGDVLKKLSGQSSRAEFATALAEVLAIEKGEWPTNRKTVFRAPLVGFFEETDFLHSICATDSTDPLLEDWNWVRPQMLALLCLAREFSGAYTEAKRQKGSVDFHDLEQRALDLLWDRQKNAPTTLAENWRRRIRFVFVDEYQDINAAQDSIIRALGGDGDKANRFLVGDVKQSIYRFRLANPGIFLRYQREWGSTIEEQREARQVIYLSDNFRSHESILNFVNPLFSVLMQKELGGIEYDAEACLQFGNRSGRAALTVAADSSPRVELHLRLTDSGQPDNGDDNNNWQSLSNSEKEARLAATLLRRLKDSSTLIWARENGREIQRPVLWGDMVIILRSPRGKAEAYAKEFARANVPLVAPRGGFYGALEVGDLLNLLRLLDNPLQDLPLLAVLRSPLAGLTACELATIRIAFREGDFWNALVKWRDEKAGVKAQDADTDSQSEMNFQITDPAAGIQSPHFQKVDRFLSGFARWRGMLRQMSLSHLLETIIDETHYTDWLLAQDRGAQRRANVERLLHLSRQFDVLQGEGLFRFLKFIDAQQEEEIDIEPATAEGADAVRLMSIHQSKGLEFPVVIVADLGKPFNFSDSNANVILDEVLGLCPRVRPPQTYQRYPSLPHWLAQRRERRETLGEELRLLYVALTRASERLILIGTTRRKTLETKWPASNSNGYKVADVAEATHALEWIGRWLASQIRADELAVSGSNALLSWTIHDSELSPAVENSADTSAGGEPAATLEELANLKSRLEWRYGREAATRDPAKTSVSVLRQHAKDETDDEARQVFDSNAAATEPKPDAPKPKPGQLTAAQVGSAHHIFLEQVFLQRVGSVRSIWGEALRMREQNILSSEQAASLNLRALAAFWSSDVARRILAQQENVRRELPFTARFSADDLARFSLLEEPKSLAGEFVIVQGVIDLAVLLPEEIWLLDFKTDYFRDADLEDKTAFYRPQLALYAEAISRIYQRPVTQRWLHFLMKRKTVALC